MHAHIIKEVTNILKEKKTIATIQESMKFIARKWQVEHILEHDIKIERWRKDTFVPINDTHSLG